MAVGPRLGDILSDMALELGSSEWEEEGEDTTCSTRLLLRVPLEEETASPPSVYSHDDDDDLPRRRKRPRADSSAEERVITLVHDGGTSLDLVGRQLWRGALVLSDLLVARRAELRGKAVLELGGGVGLLGVVLRLVASDTTKVVVTDRDDDVLSLARRNLRVNAHLEPIDGRSGGSTVAVRELDWLGAWPAEPPAPFDRTNDRAHGWSADDLRTLGKLDVILAADCVYDEALTDGLFHCLRTLLRLNPAAKAWVTLEKRFNFELATLSVQAHGYRRFLHHLGLDPGVTEAESDAPRAASTGDVPEQLLPRLQGRQLPVDFPKYLDYDRAPQLELWEITMQEHPEVKLPEPI